MVRTVPWMMALAESTRLRMAPDASFTMPFRLSNWPAATVASARSRVMATNLSRVPMVSSKGWRNLAGTCS